MGYSFNAAARGISPSNISIQNHEGKTKASTTVDRPGGGKITVTIYYDSKIDAERKGASDLEKTILKMSPLIKSLSNVDVQLSSEGKILNHENVKGNILNHLASEKKPLNDELMEWDLRPEKRSELRSQVAAIDLKISDIQKTNDIGDVIFNKASAPLLRQEARREIPKGVANEKPAPLPKRTTDPQQYDVMPKLVSNLKLPPRLPAEDKHVSPQERIETQMRDLKDIENSIKNSLDATLHGIDNMLKNENITAGEATDLTTIHQQYSSLRRGLEGKSNKGKDPETYLSTLTNLSNDLNNLNGKYKDELSVLNKKYYDVNNENKDSAFFYS